MNILCVTENLGSGGAERQLTRLAVMLSHSGHDVKVVTWVNRDFHGQYLKDNGVENIKIDFPISRRIPQLASLMRRHKTRAVISYLPMANKTACLARLLAPGVKRLIVSERSHTTTWDRSQTLQYNIYRLADSVVANSHSEADNIASHMPFLAHKTLAIPNFVDTDLFQPASGGSALAHKPLRLISVGRVIPVKNVLAWLRALRLLADKGYDFTSQWWGDTYDAEYKQKVERVTRELVLQDRFKLMGENHDISRAYREADAFVLPSLVEGYPNVLVEAMASGLPVACSNVCENPRIVTDGKNGFLFNPADVEEMARAVERLLTLDPADRQALSNTNRAHVLDHNSPSAFLNAYEELLK